MRDISNWAEFSKCSTTNTVIFQLYELELWNSIIIYSLFFSSCCHRIFGSGLDIKIYRMTILSNKVWCSYYTSGASRACKTLIQPVIPKAWILQKIYGNFALLKFYCCIPDFSVVLLFFSDPRSDKLCACEVLNIILE